MGKRNSARYEDRQMTAGSSKVYRRGTAGSRNTSGMPALLRGLLSCMACLLFSAVPVAAKKIDSAASLMKEGLNHLQDQNFESAFHIFSNAVETAEAQELDAGLAAYNQGVAAHRMGRYEEASSLFKDALESREERIKNPAYFNRGTASLQLAKSLNNEKNLQEAKQHSELAMHMFEQALTRDPAFDDARKNYELTMQLDRELEEKIKEQQQEQQDDPQDEDQEEDEDNQDEQEQDSGGEQEQDSGGEQEQDQDSGNDEESDDEQEQQDSGEEEENEQQNEESESGQNEQEQDNNNQNQNQGSGSDQPQPQSSEELTEEEAEMMLETMKQQEQSDRNKARLILGTPQRVLKDW